MVVIVLRVAGAFVNADVVVVVTVVASSVVVFVVVVFVVGRSDPTYSRRLGESSLASWTAKPVALKRSCFSRRMAT
jgi:hypothetical protein